MNHDPIATAMIGLLALASPLFPVFAAEYRVSSAADIARATSELRPGDVLVIADGDWKDQSVVFSARGTAEKPITLCAGTPGKVLLIGKSSLLIDGEYVVVSGLFLKDGQATGDGVKLAGRFCRLTDTAVVGGAYKFFIFNTIVDSRGPLLELDAGLGSSGRTLRPENITLANNLFSVSDGPLLKGMEGGGFKWIGNLASAPAGMPFIDHPGIKYTNASLARAANGLWRPSADSPVRGAAEGWLVSIKTDMDGQPRTARQDVGADQFSQAPVTNRPLSARDVGTSWMSRAE